MAKFSGMINDKLITFASTKELKNYPYKKDDKIFFLGPGGKTISTVDSIMNFVGIKRNKYGYSMNKRDKGQLGYYK